MIQKTINIGGVEETFRCSGRTPRVYRDLVNRDMLLDMQTFSDEQEESEETGEEVSAETIDKFYGMAYVMAYHAAMADDRLADFPKTVDEWLERFPMLPLMRAISDIYGLWTASNETLVEEKNV